MILTTLGASLGGFLTTAAGLGALASAASGLEPATRLWLKFYTQLQVLDRRLKEGRRESFVENSRRFLTEIPRDQTGWQDYPGEFLGELVTWCTRFGAFVDTYARGQEGADAPGQFAAIVAGFPPPYQEGIEMEDGLLRKLLGSWVEGEGSSLRDLLQGRSGRVRVSFEPTGSPRGKDPSRS